MQQTGTTIIADNFDPAIILLFETIDDICGVIPTIQEAGQAHAGIAAPLFDDVEPNLGFLGPSKSYNRNWVPNLAPLKQRTYDEYMGKLQLQRGDTHDHLMIELRLPRNQYLFHCLECGARFRGDNKQFHDGLCPVHQEGYRWVSVSEIEMDDIPGYSSGAKVIHKTRAYTPK